MELNKDDLLEFIKPICPEAEANEHRGQLSVTLPGEFLLGVARELRDNPELSFDMLTDITAIDLLTSGNRFEVVCFLYSNKFKTRLRLKVPADEKNPACPSLTPVWESANWYERETYDMYGIVFEGHPSLRRFYMPEDFNDPVTGEPLHPLRKDFPMSGIPGSLPLPPYPEKYGEPDN